MITLNSSAFIGTNYQGYITTIHVKVEKTFGEL